MPCQKPLPQFGEKVSYDMYQQASSKVEEQRRKLQSVYSTQLALHQVELDNSLHKAESEILKSSTSLSNLFRNVSVHYKECNTGHKAVGIWIREIAICVLLRQRGTTLQNCKNKFKVRLKDESTADTKGCYHYLDALPIEETIYLAERSSLLVFNSSGYLLSIDMLYKDLSENDTPNQQDINNISSVEFLPSYMNLPLNYYLVYSSMRRSGMSLKRHCQFDISHNVKNPETILTMLYGLNPKVKRKNKCHQLREAADTEDSSLQNLVNSSLKIEGLCSEATHRSAREGHVWNFRCHQPLCGKSDSSESGLVKLFDQQQSEMPVCIEDADTLVISFLQQFDHKTHDTSKTSALIYLTSSSGAISAPIQTTLIPFNYSASQHELDMDCKR